MLKRIVVILFLCSLALAWSLPAGADEAPKRIAVFPLKTDAGIKKFWEGDFDPGAAMTAILTTDLVHSNRYAVIDRSNLDKIAQEQNLSLAGQITPDTAAQMGRMMGAQYIVTGAVVQFAATKRSGIGGISLPGVPVAIGGGGQRVNVTVEIHVTNVNTGQISAAIRGTGEEVVQSLAFGAFANGIGIAGGTEEFENSGLGKAMHKASEAVCSQMETVQYKDVPQAPSMEGVVIDIEGSNITLNIGSKNGVFKGQRFSVSRPKKIIDPVTNQPRTLNRPVGEMQVIAVDEETCTCRAAGGAMFQVKDKAKSVIP